MGNLFGKKCGEYDDEDVRRKLNNKRKKSSGKVRIKVRMTRVQFEELMTHAGRDNSDLGRMILQECLQGKLCAHVVAARGLASDLGSIKEE